MDNSNTPCPSTPDEIKENIQEGVVRVPLIITLAVLAGEILQITGLIGIGLLKGWALHAFLLGLALSFTINVSSGGGDSSSPLVALLAGVYWITAGAVLALSYNRLEAVSKMVWDGRWDAPPLRPCAAPPYR